MATVIASRDVLCDEDRKIHSRLKYMSISFYFDRNYSYVFCKPKTLLVAKRL